MAETSTAPVIPLSELESVRMYGEKDGTPKSLVQIPGNILLSLLTANAQGFKRYATTAARDADTAQPTGVLGYVYLNAGSPTDPANGWYQWSGAGWVAASWISNDLVTTVQPLVDQAEAWAEGTLPGGAGTKSAKEHALDLAAAVSAAGGAADAAAASAATAATAGSTAGGIAGATAGASAGAAAAAPIAAAAALDADRAEEAAGFAEEFSAPVYASQAAGEAATTTGQFFRVPIGTTPETYNRYERRAAGSVLVDPLATTSVLASAVRTKGAALVKMENGNNLQTQVSRDAVLASPHVNALRLGWTTTSGAAEVIARKTNFEQPVRVLPTTLTERFWGMVRGNGLHWHVAYDARSVMVENPDTGRVWQLTAAQLGLAPTAFDGTQKWRDAIVTADGLIIFVAYSATWFLVIDSRSMRNGDPTTVRAWAETFNLPASALSGAAKWDGGTIVGDTGVLAPYNATTVPFIDLKNWTVRLMTATELGLALSTSLGAAAKYSGIVAVGNIAYCVCFGAANVLVINVPARTATQPNYGLDLSDANKFRRAVVVGLLIYFGPFDSTTVMVINTANSTALRSAMGASLTGAGKWRALVAIGQRVICIPGGAGDFLDIDTSVTTGSIYGTATRTNFSIYDVRAPTVVANITGGLKWGGALVYRNVIHGSPCGQSTAGQDLLRLDRAANAGAGQAVHTDLRAITLENKATQWFGCGQALQRSTGRILTYWAPASATDFVVIHDEDPNNDNPPAWRSTLGLILPTTDQKMQGLAPTGDGCLIGFPRSGLTQACKIDPNDLTGSEFGTATLFDDGGARDLDTGATGISLGTGVVDSQLYHSVLTGMDGIVRGVPYKSEKVLRYDYRAPAGQKFTLTNYGLDLSGADKWVGAELHPSGWMVCAARSHTKFLLIMTNPLHPLYDQAFLTDFGKDLNAESGLTTAAELAMKWSYPILSPRGRIICMVRRAKKFACIDLSDTSEHWLGKLTFETFGLPNLDAVAGTDGYTIAAKATPTGLIIAAAVEGLGPAGTGPFCVIDDNIGEGYWTDFGLGAAINSGNKVAGCGFTAAGRLIYVSRSANYSMTLTFKGVTPPSRQLVLGPNLNKTC